jgi:hypothetical protein
VAFILRNKTLTHLSDKQQLVVGHLQQIETQIVVKNVEENEKAIRTASKLHTDKNCQHHA